MAFIYKHIPKISDKMPDYQVASSFYAVKSRHDRTDVATQLKYKGTNEQILNVFNRLCKSNRLIGDLILGNTRPTTLKQLGNGENCIFFKPTDIEKEINWVILSLKKYKKDLQLFCKVRKDVERHILLAEYAEAERILDESISQIGYTVWYYEMKLVILGQIEDYDRSYSFLSSLNEQKRDDHSGYFTILLSDLFNRSQKNVSPFEFDSNLYSRYKGNRNDFQSDRFFYFLFRINYYQHYDIKDMSVTLIMESLNSMVDRYCLLLYVLRTYATREDGAHFDSALRFAKRLYNISLDSQLYPFIAKDDISKLPDDYYNETFIHILDAYYTGRYQDTVSECQHYLLQHPTNFDAIKIYCRALLFLRNGYRSITGDRDSLLNQIALNVYHIMTEKDKDQFVDRLYQLNKNVYGIHIAAAIDDFIREERHTPRHETLRLLYTTQFDPFFVNIFTDDDIARAYLEAGLQRMPESIALNYQFTRAKKQITDNPLIVDYIRSVDNAKILFENQEYDSALENWGIILEESRSPIPTSQTAVDYIFRTHVALGVPNRKKAVKFFVDNYIYNKAFVSKVETSQFLKDITRTHYDGLRASIDLLVFVFLNAESYPQKQFVLQRFCEYKGVTYPSELIKVLAGKDSEKVELLFSILLNEDILFHYYKLKSTVDVLEEKLRIVTFLKTTYTANPLYSKKYTELLHELIAYRGMKKLDDSKIYVNEDAIMKYELHDIDDLYDRFGKQVVLAGRGKVYLLVNELKAENTGEIIKNVANYSSDAVTEVAVQIFSKIRLVFLKSRFGLGTYLSTRIRHGVFEGELRSCLERLHIIYKTTGNNYVSTKVWQRRYNLDSDDGKKLDDAIIRFSRSIDTCISSFKDEVIQIRIDDESKEKGDFYYGVTNEEINRHLMDIYHKTDNAESFCRQTMAYLWDITETCLDRIRNKVQTQLRPQFFNHLQILQTDIDSLTYVTQFHQDFISNINNAREELTTKLTKVENWFHRQETKYEDFRLEDHIQMAMRTAMEYYSIDQVNIQGDQNQSGLVLMSQYNASMFDLLSIFFSNMLRHSKPEPVPHFVIAASLTENNILHLHFENLLSNDTDEKKLNKRFSELIVSDDKLQKEGGSGLVKALNIVRYDFGDIHNSITIFAEQGRCITDIHFNLTNMLVNRQ